MKIEEFTRQDIENNWSNKLVIEGLYKRLTEEERKFIWSDGAFYSIGDRYYCVYDTTNPLQSFDKVDAATSYGEPLGCCMATRTVIVPKNTQTPRSVDVLTLFVRPEARGKHLASWLVEHAIRKSECDYIMAKVRGRNRISQNLFLNLGFEVMNDNFWETLATPDDKIFLLKR